MAINFIKKEDLSHITRTTRQWETTIDRYEVIPKGVLCIELCNDKLTKIKIGNGHLIYEQLPYVSDVNLSDYYTKEETNNLIKNLKSIKIKGEASSLSDLPLRGNEEGDLWFVNKPHPDTHNRYDEYVWYNNKWESFGSSDIDLSEYAKKSYVDEHIQEVQDEITEIIESGYLHKHNNKNILDQTSAVYNVEKDNKLRDLHNYDDSELREKAHTHLNKNILDQTDAVYNRDKDDKLRDLHNYDDTDIKDRISSLESVAHSHDNQDVLDRTTAAFTKEQALTLLDCKDFKGTDGVHDGYHGFVPAPTKDDIGKVLGANGEWVEGGSSGGDTITEGGGIEITTDPQTNVKTVSVNAGTGLEIDQQTGELYVTATGGDTIAEGSGIDITTDSQTDVKTISVDIGNGLQFNQNSEIDINTGDGLSVNQNNALDINTGEGLQINQNNELEVNIGNGLSINNNNAVELDKATTTTIGGIIVGDNLSIDNTGKISADEYTPGEGISIDSNKEVSVKYNSDGLSINASDELELDKATKNSIGGVIVGDNINVSNGTISVPVATDSSLGVVNPTDGLSVDNTGELSVNTGDGLSINQDNEIGINIGEGLQFNQDNELEVGIGDGLSINASDEVELDKATTSSIGGVIIGDNIDVNNGTISVPKAASNKLGVVKPSDGLSVDSNGVLTVDVGDGLSIDSTTKEVNVNTGDGLFINQNNDIDVNIASSSSVGVVKPTTGLQVDANGELTLKNATTTELGGVIVGDNIDVNNATISVPKAASNKLGVVKPSDGLSIDSDGVLSVDTGEGLSIDSSTKEVNVNTGDGLFINASNELEVNLGSGLQFDANGAIEVVNSGTEYTAGDGIDINANDEISVKLGNHLSIDQTTGDINVDDIIEYTAGDGVTITLVDDIDVFNNGDGWENLCYSNSTGNDTTGNYQWEIHSPISHSLTIPHGATQIKAVAKDTNDNLIWTSFSWIDSNDYHFASTSPNDGHYDDWFDIPSGSVKVNFGVRWTRLSTSQAISTSDVDSVTVMFDNGDTKRIDVNAGDGLFIDSTNNDVNVKIGQALSINNSNEIDVNLGRALSINDNNEIDVDIATATSLGVVKAGSGLNIDEYGNLSTQAAPFRIGRALSLDDESVRLPSGYAKVKYVENPSNAGVRTGFRPSDYPNAKYVGSVSVESVGSSSTYPTRYLCGASGWTGSLKMPLDGISGGLPIKTFFYIGNGNNPSYTTTTFQLGERFDFEASSAGGFKINNELVQAVATPPSGFGTYFLALFGSGASNGPGEPGFKGRMYYFRIYNTDDTLLANFVPAVRLGDSVVGFFNTVNNTFYSSETSTQFTTDMDQLDVDEPDWVLNAKIATSNSLGVVKPSTGLVVNAQGALTLDKASASTIGGVKVGNNLSIDSNGVLSANIINYSAGHAIEIVGDLSIDKFRWEITANAGDSMVAFRYFEYSDSDHIAFAVQSGTIEWSDGSTVSYPSGYDETFAGMMENRTKCTVTGWGGSKTLIMTFTLSQSIMLSNIAYFRWKTDDYMSGRQPTEFNIYAHDSVNDEWILLKEVTDHSLVPSSGNTWSNYIEIEPEIEPGTINVKYGNGLTLNQNNELEVPTASASTLGLVKIGNGLTVTSDGTISTVTGKAYIAGEGIDMSSSQYEFSAENEEYLFRSQVTCELHGSFNREFQKTTDDTALGIVWNVYDSGTLWSGPMFVGLDADSVKYTTNGTTYNATGTFQYLGKTWYYGSTQMYVSNIDGTDYDGNMVVDTETYASTSDTVDFCKSLIDRARVILKVDEISLLPATEDTLGGIKIGEGLSIDENNVVSSTVYEEGQGITFETSGSTDSFNVKNKEYYFEDEARSEITGNFGPRSYWRAYTDDPCLAVIFYRSDTTTAPMYIGITENSVKIKQSWDGNVLAPDGTFDYKGYTWYYTFNYGLYYSSGVDQQGHLLTISGTSADDLEDVAKHVIDLAELISPGIQTYDVWNSGTGWLNGAYDNYQSDYFWTNWYYTYHSKQDEYLEVPAGAVKMRLIGISNENNSRLQGGGVDCFDSTHHHFATVGCVTDEWADIPEGTVYIQFGVKWNESNNRYISSSDIKSVTLEIKVPKNNAITAKLGDGLTFDENDAITLDESIKLIIHCVGTPLT